MVNILRYAVHLRNAERVARAMRDGNLLQNQINGCDRYCHFTTINRNRVRFDIVAMLAHRRRFSGIPEGGINIYLAYDASPQGGVEIFNTFCRMEHVDKSGSAFAIELRRFPLTTLGVGKASVADKTQALLHQIFLECGPSISNMRKMLDSVRQCLSDMGTEFQIANSRDCLPQIYKDSEAASGTSPDGRDSDFLFPNALQVPGTLHIIDLCIRVSLESGSWWSDFEANLKAIAQWSTKGRRDILRMQILKGADNDITDMQRRDWAKALEKTPEKFAKWRWQTSVSYTHLRAHET